MHNIKIGIGKYILFIVLLLEILIALPEKINGQFEISNVEQWINAFVSALAAIATCHILRSVRISRVIMIDGAVILTTLLLQIFVLPKSSAVGLILIGIVMGSIDYIIQLILVRKYKAIYINFAHAIWGLGAAIGVFICGGSNSQSNFLVIWIVMFVVLMCITGIYLANRKAFCELENKESQELVSRGETARSYFRQYGVWQIILACFFYNGIQNIAATWGKPYLMAICKFDSSLVEKCIIMFYTALFMVRIITGLLSLKMNSEKLVRIGQIIAAFGAVMLIMPGNRVLPCMGIMLLGIGCAPIYPNLLFKNNDLFVKSSIPVILGMEVSAATLGSTFVPAIYSWFERYIGIKWYPYMMLILFVAFIVLCETVNVNYRRYSNNQKVMSVLHNQYLLIAIVNIDKDLMQLLKGTSMFTNDLVSTYSKYLATLRDRIVSDEKKKMFEQVFMNNYVTTPDSTIEIELKDLQDNTMWVSMQLVGLQDKENERILLIKNIDEFHEIQQMGLMDRATGLYNKNAYLKMVEELKSKMPEYLRCIYIDINGLHERNNRYGHQAGDLLILNVAKKLGSTFEMDKVFRIGGDEFVVFCCDRSELPIENMNMISTELEKNNDYISYGICDTGVTKKIDLIIEIADERMLEAKKRFYENNDKNMRL